MERRHNGLDVDIFFDQLISLNPLMEAKVTHLKLLMVNSYKLQHGDEKLKDQLILMILAAYKESKIGDMPNQYKEPVWEMIQTTFINLN
jgi:hypothetical protein